MAGISILLSSPPCCFFPSPFMTETPAHWLGEFSNMLYGMFGDQMVNTETGDKHGTMQYKVLAKQRVCI